MTNDLCVIFNAAAGKRRARRRLQQLQRDWSGQAEFWPTRHPGHAIELARRAVEAGFRQVAAAGGDGTVHEVANGLLQTGRRDVTFVVVPLGSANDYAHSLEQETAAVSPDGIHTVDVGLVSDGAARQRYFVCCLGLGLNGAVTQEARRLHRLQGLALYGWATLRALWYHYGCPPLQVQIDDQPPQTRPTLMLSVLVGRREGGFVLAPNARLDDGWLDFVQAGNLSRCQVLWLLPRLALAGPPAEHPQVRQGRCRHLKVLGESPLIVHVDGEFFCQTEDNVRHLDIRILPGALRVQKRGEKNKEPKRKNGGR